MEKLIKDYSDYLSHTKQNDTVRSYISDICDYYDWCKDHGLDFHQINPSYLNNYYHHLRKRNIAAGTMLKKFLSLRRFYRYLGFDC